MRLRLDCPRIPLHCTVLTLALLLRPVPSPAAPPDVPSVQRVLTLLAAVGEEYREGVNDGEVVRPIELAEATSFLQDAEQRFRSLNPQPATADELLGRFVAAAAAIEQHAAATGVCAQLSDLQQRITAVTGVSEQVYPPAAPSAAHGQALFGEYCATCHGLRGDGKGPNAAGLQPPPANFADPQFIRGETPYDFFHVISLGKAHTAMPVWDGVLSVQDRWDLISYLWTLAPGADGLAEGQGIYLTQCVGCHGVNGNGQGQFAPVLLKPAFDLSQPQAMARRTDAQLFSAVSDGIAAAPMPAFSRSLGDADRWKAVAYLRLLSLGGPASSAGTPSAGMDPQRFSGLIRLLGRAYAEASTAEQSAQPVEYAEATALVAQVTEKAEAGARALDATSADQANKLRRDSAGIARHVHDRVPAAAVSAATAQFAEWVEAHAVELAGSPTLAAAPLAPAPTADEPSAVLVESARLLEAAVAAYEHGDPQAPAVAADAYLQFEPLESRLGATHPALKTQIEERFLDLRQRLRTPGAPETVRATAAAIRADFAAAQAALRPHDRPYALLIESATIIVREGLEIVLVVGALLAYVSARREPAMLRSVYAGTGVGVAASLVTAFLMGELLHLHPAASDLLEGITMLLAAVVLFWVSYWLISKTEADKWQRYIRDKVQAAVSGRRRFALASAAFLAVYREGFETVLFYQALYASAPAASVNITAGLVGGGCLLAIVYVLLRRFQVQIPIRQFFFWTGLFLYVMAAVFAGQGIHELQEAGIVAVTAVSGVPSVPLLGLYPSVQTLATQALFIALLLYASAVTVRRRRAAAAGTDSGTEYELRALRVAVETLRGELEMTRQTVSAAPAAAGDRLREVLGRVEEVAGQLDTRLASHATAVGASRRRH